MGTKIALPANSVFWEKSGDGDERMTSLLNQFIRVERYKTELYNPHPFYKPISRVFSLNFLHGKDQVP